MTDKEIQFMQRAHTARSHYKAMIGNHLGDSLDEMTHQLQAEFFEEFNRSMDIVDIDVITELVKEKLSCCYDEVG